MSITLGIGLGLPTYGLYAGQGGNFVPTSLPSLLQWVRADAANSLFQDAAGSIPAIADTDPVALVKDQSGNGRDFSTAVAGRRLTLKLAQQNGKPVLRAAGASMLAASAFVQPATTSIYAAVTRSSIPTTFSRVVSSEFRHFLGTGPVGTATSFKGTGAAWGTTNDSGAGWLGTGSANLLVLSAVNDGVNDTLYVQGCSTGSRANAPTAGSTVVNLAGSPVPDQFWSGDICEVLIYGAAHSDAQRQQVEAYLSARWGAAAPGPAMPSYTRYAGNPVITKGAGGSWEETDVANPDVFWDGPNSRWVMNYSGYSATSTVWGTGLAYATNLLGPWTKEPANPVITVTTLGGVAYIAGNGAIVLKGSTYYCVLNGDTGGNKVYALSSTNLTSWTVLNGGASIPTLNGQFDPSLELDADGVTFRLGITKAAAPNRYEQVYTSTDCVTWTLVGTRVRPIPTTGFFGEANTTTSKAGDVGLALTHDYDPGTGGRSVVGARLLPGGGYASPSPNGVLIAPSGAGWDSANCFDSCQVSDGGTRYLFYAGAPLTGTTQGMGAQIGVATA